MKPINHLDYESLREIYTFANTPNYLFENFRQNESIRSLARSTSIKEMGKLFLSVVNRKKVDIDDLLAIYAIMIGLTLKQYSLDTRRFYDELSKYDLKWLKELKDICLSRFRATDINVVDRNYILKDGDRLDIRVSSSKKDIDGHVGRVDKEGF